MNDCLAPDNDSPSDTNNQTDKNKLRNLKAQLKAAKKEELEEESKGDDSDEDLDESVEDDEQELVTGEISQSQYQNKESSDTRVGNCKILSLNPESPEKKSVNSEKVSGQKRGQASLPKMEKPLMNP